MVKIMTQLNLKRNGNRAIFYNIKLFYINALAIPSLLITAGCSPMPESSTDSPYPAHHQAEQKNTFSPWRIEGCRLEAVNNHITLSTDGSESHQTIRVSVSLPHKPQDPPLISLMGIGGMDINQAGRGMNWSFELPNSPYATAQMMADRVYAVVEYTPVPSYRLPTPQPMSATFSLKKLPKALLALHKECEN